ncbi:adenosine 5'-monophosphoramidase HINT3 [Colletes latitarsis]|uniref:adenosine 5'-monophosphoramidase HINT3 n=1 Tax=Colletes latitarsis TaxID=2605962 RepID=UPI004037498A
MAELSRKDDCIFCKIIYNEEPSTKIYEDEYVICIKNIKPVSTHHYLILPKTHIRNAKDLTREHAEIFEKMISALDIVIQQQGLDRAATRTGFHWPPFNTVNHLHLHVISPVENINFLNKIIYLPGSFQFVSIEYVHSYIQRAS